MAFVSLPTDLKMQQGGDPDAGKRGRVAFIFEGGLTKC
jgi:hypothetical protein